MVKHQRVFSNVYTHSHNLKYIMKPRLSLLYSVSETAKKTLIIHFPSISTSSLVSENNMNRIFRDFNNVYGNLMIYFVYFQFIYGN